MRKFTLGIHALFLSLSLGWSPLARADAVTEWNAHAGKAAVAACISPIQSPLFESRMYAMMHIAIHDALNAITRRSHPYVLDIQGPSGASVDATVATAAHDVLLPLLNQLPFPQDCIDAGVASVEADYTAALAAITDGTPKTQGIVVGHAAAATVLALRVADGSDAPLQDFDYPQGTKPGEYRFTPGFPFLGGPNWPDVTPFVLRDSSQFRPGLPYAVTSRKYTADFNEVKYLGGDGVTTPSARTPEQTQIALFWVKSSPLGWNRIARTVATAAGLDPWANARLFGLLNMALADGYIAGFDAKFHYNYWRPITAIQLAATDGNPNTEADPTWTPLALTPPIPDYPSTHSVEGGAAAQVLERFFETDDISFRTCSLTLPLPIEQCGGSQEVQRTFASFSHAAEENGVSRIYVGFHFRKAVEEGIAQGRKIGNRAVNHFLRPVE